MIPSFTSEKAKTASGAAIAMSDAATSPAPPPRACPCTRVTTGAGQPSIASSIARSAFASATFSSYERSTEERIQSTSAPGGEARSVAREHDGARTADADERLGELGDQRRVERVAPVGRVNVMRRTSPSRSVRRCRARAGA